MSQPYGEDMTQALLGDSGGASVVNENTIVVGLNPGNQILIGQDVPLELQFFTDVDGDDINILACIIFYLGDTSDYHWEGIGYANGDTTNTLYASGMTYASSPSTEEKLFKGNFHAVNAVFNHNEENHNYYPNPPLPNARHFFTQVTGTGRTQWILDTDVSGNIWSDVVQHYSPVAVPVGAPMMPTYGLLIGLLSGAATVGSGIGNVATALSGGGANYAGNAVALVGSRRFRVSAFTLVRSTVAGDSCQLEVRYGNAGNNTDPVVASSGPVPLPVAGNNVGVRCEGRFDLGGVTNPNGKFTMTLVRTSGTGTLTAQSSAGLNTFMEVSDAGAKGSWLA